MPRIQVVRGTAQQKCAGDKPFPHLAVFPGRIPGYLEGAERVAM